MVSTAANLRLRTDLLRVGALMLRVGRLEVVLLPRGCQELDGEARGRILGDGGFPL